LNTPPIGWSAHSPGPSRPFPCSLAHRLPAALQGACDEVEPLLAPSGRVFLEKLRLWVVSNTAKTAARLAGAPKS